MTDEALMRSLQKGDRTAMESLVLRYHRPLLSYFYRLSSDYHLAQDLAQDCLFRLLNRAPLYAYPAPLRPWLYRIAINIWRDHAKSAAYRHGRAAVALDDTEERAGPEPSPEEMAVERLMAGQALAAIRDLPPSFSEVLLLRFCQSLTVPEIASVLDLPEGTVKSRIYHGLRHVRSRLVVEVNA